MHASLRHPLVALLLLAISARAELNFQKVTMHASYVAYERDVGDVDGDGDNDVITVSEGEQAIRAFLAPNWNQVLLVTPTGSNTWPRADDFKTRDLDGDGDLDLIVRLGPAQNSDASGIAAWFDNQSNTGWVQRTIGTSPEYVKDIVVDDLDGDGRPDVIFRMDARTHVWFQETNSWTQVEINHPSHEGMETGDLDMDGDPDIILNGFWFPTPNTPAACRIAGNYVQRTIDSAWFTQAGDWTANSCKVVVGDFDGDGSNDVAFSQSERAAHNVTWYRSATPLVDASWTGRTVALVDYCHNLQAADWDLDGDVDLLAGGMVQSPQKGLRLYLNNGGGTNWSLFPIQSDGSYSAETGDIDNDGDLDIVGILNWDSGPSYIYRNNAGGGPSLDFWQHLPVSVSHVRTFGLAFTDVDGDGDQDIASAHHIYRNPGSAMTGAWPRVSLASGLHIFLAPDVDSDSRADLLVLQDNIGASRIDLFWYEATDAGATGWTNVVRFGDIPRSDHAEGFQGYKLADLIAGGKPEVVLSTMQGIYQFVIPVANATTGGWPRAQLAANDSDEGIGIADVDGDTLLDVTFSSGGTKSVKWARNPGTGGGGWTVYTIGSFPEADWPDRCEAADLNGDGRADIVVTEENSGGSPDALAYWWERPVNAIATNWVRHLITTQYTMNSMDLADVSQDGIPDLVIGEHRGNKNLDVWENDGAGNFARHPVSTGLESHLGGRTVDLDGDGDLDLVSIAYDDFTSLHAWRNDSPSGTPRAARPSVTPAGGIFDEPVSVTLASATGGAAIWYTLNGTTPTNAPPSLAYSNSFLITTSAQLRARAFKDGFDPSLVASTDFTGPQAQTPLIAPPGGSFTSQIVVTVTCPTTGVTIRITTNGLDPDEASPVYSGPLILTTTTTVKARAFRSGITPSLIASASFARFTSGSFLHWRFDERFGSTAHDTGGSAKHGTVVGATWTSGHFDNALSFDGTDDHVNLGGLDAPAVTGFTACAWVKLDAAFNDGADARILSKSTGTAEQDHYWMLSTYIVSADRRLRFRLKTSGSTTTLIASSGNLPVNEWHHVAITYDGAAMRIFLDGAEVGTAAKSGDMDTNNAVNAFIGASPPVAAAAFKGIIDDVRIYPRALSGTELQAVMLDAPVAPSHPVTSFVPAATNLVLQIHGEAGHYAILQTSTNLLAESWRNVSTQSGAGAPLLFYSAATSRFEALRIRLD